MILLYTNDLLIVKIGNGLIEIVHVIFNLRIIIFN